MPESVRRSLDLKKTREETEVTIQKKSLISTLNTTKKAIVASKPVASAASSSEPRTNARRNNNRAVSRAQTLTRVSFRKV